MDRKWTHVRVDAPTLERIDAEVVRRRREDGGAHSRASVVASWAERCEAEAAREASRRVK